MDSFRVRWHARLMNTSVPTRTHLRRPKYPCTVYRMSYNQQKALDTGHHLFITDQMRVNPIRELDVVVSIFTLGDDPELWYMPTDELRRVTEIVPPPM
jgi:hypothetical protein